MYAVCVHNCGDRKRASDPLESELKAVVSCSTWELGTKLESSERAGSVLNHWAISPAPVLTVWMQLVNISCFDYEHKEANTASPAFRSWHGHMAFLTDGKGSELIRAKPSHVGVWFSQLSSLCWHNHMLIWICYKIKIAQNDKPVNESQLL